MEIYRGLCKRWIPLFFSAFLRLNILGINSSQLELKFSRLELDVNGFSKM